MYKVICVSGTPGTGKTTYSKKISQKKNYYYLDVNKLIKDNNLIEKHDKKRDTDIVDVDKLNKVLVKKIKSIKNNKHKGIIIDSHLSHYLPKEIVDEVIITKCNINTLKKRLSKRGYSYSKIRENLDAEIFDICRVEALEMGHKVEVKNTD